MEDAEVSDVRVGRKRKRSRSPSSDESMEDETNNKKKKDKPLFKNTRSLTKEQLTKRSKSKLRSLS